jgi:N4-gp56 family major capsid protein
MANVNTSTMSNAVKTFYDSRLLMRAIPRLVHCNFGERATLNKNGSYEWRKYGALSAKTTALTQGTTPVEESSPSLTLVTATPSWYGAWLSYTDQLDLQSMDPVVTWMSGVLGEQAGVSVDTIVRNAITAGATKQYSGDATSRATLDAPGDNISYEDLLYAMATIWGNSALTLMGGKYAIIVHPHSIASLYQDPVFVNLFVEEQNPIREGHIGKILNCDIFVSANAREYADGGAGSTTDVYSFLIIAKESYGQVSMAGLEPKLVDTAGPEGDYLTGDGSKASPVQLIFKNLGETGFDPLDQRATAGWKLTEDVQILNSSWIIDLEHTNALSDA